MTVRIIGGDCRDELRKLADKSVHCVVTSPPYWGLRDYGTGTWTGGDAGCDHLAPERGGSASSGLATPDNGLNADTIRAKVEATRKQYASQCRKCGALRVDKQLGLEPRLTDYIGNMVAVFREVRRVLRDDGTLWLNIGDTYITDGGSGWQGKNGSRANREFAAPNLKGNSSLATGLKPKDLALVPQRLAIALQEDGWWVRSDIVWHKPNPMPESIEDRPAKTHEYIWLLTKSQHYFYDNDAIREPVADDTYARYGRKHSGYAPDGQDKHGGLLAPRPNVNAGIPPLWPQPSGWDTGPGGHGSIHRSGRAGISRDGYDDRKKADTAGTMARPPMTMRDREYHPLGRNKRTVWTVATSPFPDAHFATFPPDLIEPCILAGTSAKGCCPTCGAPWLRDGVKQFIAQEDVSAEKGERGAGTTKAMDDMNRWHGYPRGRTIVEAFEWKMGCQCDYLPPVPAVVLDPFGGAGTTGLVCDRLQRDAILIELKPQYAAMAEKRIAGDASLFSQVTTM